MYNNIALFFNEKQNCWEPRELNGYHRFILPTDVDSIIDDLVNYLELHTDEEILQRNRYLEEYFFDSHKIENEKKKDVKIRLSGYVYIFECADKYKIGYSKDVNKRLQQLDTRPFKLNLVYKRYSDYAYEIEQRIHNQLASCNITNEWYEIDKLKLLKIVNEVSELVEKEH